MLIIPIDNLSAHPLAKSNMNKRLINYNLVELQSRIYYTLGILSQALIVLGDKISSEPVEVRGCATAKKPRVNLFASKGGINDNWIVTQQFPNKLQIKSKGLQIALLLYIGYILDFISFCKRGAC